MSEKYAKKQVEAADADARTPSLLLPDAASTADIVLNQAMEFCAQKMGLGAAWLAVEQLKEGDGAACSYCRYSMAKQMAGALGSLDEKIRAVYVYEYDATPEDVCFGKAVRTSPIHLIVWVERKTSALESLAEALDHALAVSYAALVGKSQLSHILDVQMVDDADVENRTGYGALLSSFQNQPLKIWGR
jgi:hypothetical protein